MVRPLLRLNGARLSNYLLKSSTFKPRRLRRSNPTRYVHMDSWSPEPSGLSDKNNSVLIPRREVIFSGIQPTGVPHLGNYLGALKQWVTLQSIAHPKSTLLFCIVDLHAITIPINPAALRKQKRETMKVLLAMGLDPERCIIFHQSDVPEHSELMWLLSTTTPLAALARQTQWKSKTAGIHASAYSEANREAQNVGALGLFSYPVLQTADILLYKATGVPVGEDQQQHLELARDIAGRMNRQVNLAIFPLPQTILTNSKRIMSLTDPFSKMSKSTAILKPKSVISLSDPEERIYDVLRTAVTDSVDEIAYLPDDPSRKGMSNLIELYGYCQPIPNLDFEGIALEHKTRSKKDFKKKVADAIIEELAPFKKRWELLRREDESYFDTVEKKGANKARLIARQTLIEVQSALGLRPYRS